MFSPLIQQRFEIPDHLQVVFSITQIVVAGAKKERCGSAGNDKAFEKVDAGSQGGTAERDVRDRMRRCVIDQLLPEPE